MKKNIVILLTSAIILLLSMFIKPNINDDNIVIKVKSFSANNNILNKIPSSIKEKYKYNVVLNYVNDNENADLIVTHESLIGSEYKKDYDLLRINEDNVIILNGKENLDLSNKNTDKHITLVSREVESYLMKKNNRKENLIVSDNLEDKAGLDKNIVAVLFESELKDSKQHKDLDNLGERDFCSILVNKNFKLNSDVKTCIESILKDKEMNNSEK